MENINKFKVFTIIIICTFIFAIAAIYTNTKDVTNDKTSEQNEYEQVEEYNRYNRASSDLETEIRNINQRLDELSTRVNNNNQQNTNTNSNSTNLKCRIAGTLSNRGMEEMSPNAAVNDARVNQNDLVVLCSF